MRKSRILQEGATYHVTAKINRGEHLLESDEIKNLFIDVVKRTKKNINFQLIMNKSRVLKILKNSFQLFEI